MSNAKNVCHRRIDEVGHHDGRVGLHGAAEEHGLVGRERATPSGGTASATVVSDARFKMTPTAPSSS